MNLLVIYVTESFFPQISVFIHFQGSCSVMKIILGLKDTICATFEDAGVNWESKLVAFGADGASVNLGKEAGLATLLRKQVPYFVDFHCLPHRLELALFEPQNSCKSVDDFYTVLHLIWKTYHYSPTEECASSKIYR